MKIPEWRIRTECGHDKLIWAAWDEESLRRDLKDRGYRPVSIEPWVEPAPAHPVVISSYQREKRESA